MQVEWKGKVKVLGAVRKQAPAKPIALEQLGQLRPSFVYRLFGCYCNTNS